MIAVDQMTQHDDDVSSAGLSSGTDTIIEQELPQPAPLITPKDIYRIDLTFANEETRQSMLRNPTQNSMDQKDTIYS